MALATQEDPISEWLKEANYPEGVARLRDPATSYMSPPSVKFVGAGFACRDCDWYTHPLATAPRDIAKGIGYCANPKIMAKVQFNGCCNRYSFEGISTFEKTD